MVSKKINLWITYQVKNVLYGDRDTFNPVHIFLPVALGHDSLHRVVTVVHHHQVPSPLKLDALVQTQNPPEEARGPGFGPVDVDPWAVLGLHDQGVERRHGQGRAKDQQQITLAKVLVDQGPESPGEGLTEQHDVRSHHPRPAALALGDAPVALGTEDLGLEPGQVVVALALDAVGPPEGPVGLNDLVVGNPGDALQAVNVLGVDPPQVALLVQQGQESVGEGRSQLLREDVSDQAVEGQRVLGEVGAVEHGLRIREVVLLEFEVQSSRGRSEIRDSSRGGDPGTAHDHHISKPTLGQLD